MRSVRLICFLALIAGALVYRLGAAGAEVSADVQQACTPDALRLCSEFVPDVAKITACMKRRHSELSKECLTAMRGMGRERHEARGRHEGRERHEAHETHGRKVRTHGHRHQSCDKFTHICS